jgi:dethiobiotin synthetase
MIIHSCSDRIELKELQEELEDIYKKSIIEGSGGWITEEDLKNMTPGFCLPLHM